MNSKKAIMSIGMGLLAVAGLMSCSSDESLMQGPAENAITFTSNVSRAAGTQWGQGDKIGVYMLPADGAALLSNKSYMTTAGDGTFVPASTAEALTYPKDGAAVRFVAYYPYAALADNNIYKVNIADQSHPETIDLMYSPAGPSYTTGTPALSFSHQLSQVSVTLTSTDNKDLSGVSVTLQNVPVTADYSLSTGTFSTAAGNRDVQMHYSEGTTTATFTAFLIPGQYAGGVTMVVSDGSKASKPAALKANGTLLETLEPGSNYSFSSRVSGIGKEPSITPSGKGNFFMETPTLSDDVINHANTKLVYKTYEFNKGKGNERNYSILFDKQKKMALWVAYPLNASYTGSGRDSNPWAFDPTMDKASQIDLITTGKTFAERWDSPNGNLYDRGHQIPNSDRNANEDARKQTFYMTNLTPQIYSMNQGVWKELEGHVREIAEGLGNDTLFVTTGPIFKGTTKATDNVGNKIDVPSAYFKVIAKVTRDASGNVTEAKTVAYIVPNELDLPKTDYARWTTTVLEVEKETGFIFFPAIPDKWKTSKTW